MSKLGNSGMQYVYGLDIGTRSIVGTVGYKEKDQFVVVAQEMREHATRAMLDGQIHDITAVGNTITEVTNALEQKVGQKLEQVCIAAAGRVLKTVSCGAEIIFEDEKTVSGEDILALEALGVEHAYEQFHTENNLDMKFYCVGYSVVKYYMNDYPISNLLDHKASKIALELIATFLPDDVVDGLYKAVEHTGLSVANLTLEPIAAIEVAIPEMYRMLNIGLIDVGAGTSDISITKDGSIIAYGMLPIAGDGLTEIIARNCLVDFATAESIKIGIDGSEEIEYKDIMGLTQTISKTEVLSMIEDEVDKMANQAADKLLELNGEKPVSAVFVVGGGGKIEGYTSKIASRLGIQAQRCAVRGEDVMQNIQFMDSTLKKDSILITPLGICLNYYKSCNSFIFVTFNNQRVRLYDNNKLAVVDAAMQSDFPNNELFPKRGESINVIINGNKKVIRGLSGEPATIKVNGNLADIHTPIRSNDVIEVIPSTKGENATLQIDKIPEYNGNITINVNQKAIVFPKVAAVNGKLQSGYYQLHDGDEVEMLSYYTVKQITEFMDVAIDNNHGVYVNNQVADYDTKVYDNFTLVYTPGVLDVSVNKAVEQTIDNQVTTSQSENSYEIGQETSQETNSKPQKTINQNIFVHVNGKKVYLSGKPDYIYVDVFDLIDFDLSKPQGKSVVTKLNGKQANYTDILRSNDVLDIYWEN